jgi:hypothetical protein
MFNPKISAADTWVCGSNAGTGASLAYGKSLLASAVPCAVYDVTVANERAGASYYYLLIIDKATAAADNDVPAYPAKRIYDGTHDFVTLPHGMRLANGCAVCLSTTANVATIPNVTDAVFHVALRRA